MFAARNMMFASAAFSPLSLSPALWLDASDASTLYDSTVGGSLVAADGTVARWEDKSGNGRHATQSTGVGQPLRKTSIQNGKDAIRFDGSNDRLLFSRFDLSAATVFAVLKRTAAGTYQNPFQVIQQSTTRASIELGINNDANYGPLIVGSNGNSSIYGKGGSLLQNTSRMVSATWLGGGTSGATNYTMRDNGADVTLSNSASIGVANGASSLVGATYSNGNIVSHFGGDIMEIILYGTALSAINVTAVESYLNAKWALY